MENILHIVLDKNQDLENVLTNVSDNEEDNGMDNIVNLLDVFYEVMDQLKDEAVLVIDYVDNYYYVMVIKVIDIRYNHVVIFQDNFFED